MLDMPGPLRVVSDGETRTAARAGRIVGALAGRRTIAQTVERLGVLRLSFLLCVIVPTLIAGLYLSVMASDQYVSEARFSVRRGTETKMPPMLSGLSFLTSLTTSGASTMQDAFIVTDYVRSRTIIEDLGGKDVIAKIYAHPDADWFSRMRSDLPLEKVWKYWKRKVTATIDTQSGIVTLEIATFSPQEAFDLARRIVEKSEKLVNEISERSRNDALERARGEVTLAQERVRKAREELLQFRNANSSIDPVASATSLSETVATLMRERIKLDNDRASLLGVVAAESPIRRQLDARIANIDKQIAALRDQMTKEGQDTAISGQIAGYENLQLESQFAEKLYEVAQSAFEQARTEQDKKQLYLATIVKPALPELPLYPRIGLGMFVVMAVCFVLWSMMALLIAAVRDHMGH
ncbi:MAG: hypothetical protein J0H78_10680 [Rhizobiales bacterium]|nr:hypothetical protein [Hyphomicrobiales bacterium]